MSRAWLIVPAHPDPIFRRVLSRRLPGRLLRVPRVVRFVRVRVLRVQVLDTSTLRTMRLARVRFRDGSETWAPFDRLASDRERFLSRWLHWSGATESGAPQVPVTTRPPAVKPTPNIAA